MNDGVVLMHYARRLNRVNGYGGSRHQTVVLTKQIYLQQTNN